MKHLCIYTILPSQDLNASDTSYAKSSDLFTILGDPRPYRKC